MGGRSKFKLLALVLRFLAGVLTQDRYIRSHIPLDDLERRARFPAVDEFGRETGRVLVADQAGSHAQ
jgi:hypothetical protein